VSAPALRFGDATASDTTALVELKNATADALTERFGRGPWSSHVSERGVAFSQRHARLRVGRLGARIVSVLHLQTKKPWAIDVAYFTAARRPLYLTGMAVAAAHQRYGIGRLAMADAEQVARAWPADAIRLDAFDADAGAGSFYAKCGLVERGRVTYRGAPLIYYEHMIAAGGDPTA
jgi:GNAT superfamily N-acetyltransferase